MALTIVANIQARAGHEAIVGRELEKLVGPTLDEAGCLQYELHRDLNDSRHFLFFESWESRELWRAHMQAPHIAAYMSATDGSVEQFVLREMERVA